MQGRGGEPRHGKVGADAGNSCDHNWERRMKEERGWKEERNREKNATHNGLR